MQNDSGFTFLIGSTGATLVALYLVVVGRRYYKRGVIEEEWAHNWILDYANLANLLLRRPQQQRLTDRQVRITGLVHIGIGIAGLCLVGLGLVQAYAPKH